jgi:hypothetical protein
VMMCSDGGMKHDLTGGGGALGGAGALRLGESRRGAELSVVGLELGSVWRVSEERRDLEHSARRKPAGVDRR